PSPTASSPLSLHDALPILLRRLLADALLLGERVQLGEERGELAVGGLLSQQVRSGAPVDLEIEMLGAELGEDARQIGVAGDAGRSEEHTSELQSLAYLVCR